MTIFLYIWIGFAAVTAGLALFRKLVANREDDYLHVGPGQDKAIQQQREVSEKLARLDKLGKLLTIVTVVLGLGLCIAFVVQTLTSTGLL